MDKIFVTGATSGMILSTLRAYAEKGSLFYLVARDQQRLEILASDLRTRGARQVTVRALDLTLLSDHDHLVQTAWETLSGIDLALLAQGTLGNQKVSESSFESAYKELAANFLSFVATLTPLSNRMHQARKGTLAVISSVAGERGRQSNYVYGSAKGALSIFLQGLRNRLHPAGVRVLTIKPGFVDTPMTATLKKGPLFISAQSAGLRIFKAIETKNVDEAYIPWFWRYIMIMIRSIPERLFKKMKL